MEYTKLGSSDLNVSRICLGCMSFGDASGMQNWALGYEDSEKIIKSGNLTYNLDFNFIIIYRRDVTKYYVRCN